MGRGRSGAGKGGGGGAPKPTTPSGYTQDDLLKMPEAQRWQVIDSIIADSSIQVPSYLDSSDTSKVMYALGMNGKTTVVSDSQLDAMPGREIFRTVYERGSMPPPASDSVLDQIRNGDYTQMSGKGGSAHGRAIYFATRFKDSTVYGSQERNAMVMRSKINPNATIVSERTLLNQMMTKGYSPRSTNTRDNIALYAISQGIDGWSSGTYTMIVNRGILTSSSQNKRISKRNTSRATSATANSWSEAANAK